jgi:hypothetical protein
VPARAALSGFIRTRLTLARFLTGATGLSGTTAADIRTVTPGYGFEVEEFGFDVDSVAITGGPQTFLLRDANANTIATLVVTADLAAHGNVKTRDTDPLYRGGFDASTLTVRRVASGTAITAGAGEFYVILRQRLQARAS